MLASTVSVPSFTALDSDAQRAKLLEIMTTTLSESWTIILKVDEPLCVMGDQMDLNTHWNHQAEMIQRFLSGSLGDRGFGNAEAQDYFDTVSVMIEFLTEELRFQSKLLLESLDYLVDDVELGRTCHVDELEQYLVVTRAAIGERLEYLLGEMKRHVQETAIAA